jgi:hypothetical protein
VATFVPGKTFVECCSTHAGLVTNYEYGDLEFVDLISGHERSCSASHCGPVALESTTALAIALLGDQFTEAKSRAHKLLVGDGPYTQDEREQAQRILEIANEQRRETM